MDLSVQEVSELIGVSQEAILGWANGGKIPAYLIQESFRFNRAEIENWLIENPQEVKKSDKLHFQLYRALIKGEVLTEARILTKEAAIQEGLRRVAKKLNLDAEVLYDLVIEREYLVPTALGEGFAIPHARDFYLPYHYDSVSCVFLENPIEWGALDGKKVHTLFFLFASNDRRHLSLLAKIAHLIASHNHHLMEKPTKQALLELVRSWEGRLQGKN